MVKCSFSGEEILAGTGLMYVTKEGKMLYFKNKKCEKNFLKLNRKSLKVRWTKPFRDERAKASKESSKKTIEE
jgi:ribosomal protein L24E